MSLVRGKRHHRIIAWMRFYRRQQGGKALFEGQDILAMSRKEFDRYKRRDTKSFSKIPDASLQIHVLPWADFDGTDAGASISARMMLERKQIGFGLVWNA